MVSAEKVWKETFTGESSDVNKIIGTIFLNR